MNFLRKLERRFGRYAIPNLMYYIILLYGAGIVVSLMNPSFYYLYLSLDVRAILQGQVWRLVTFLICPPSSGIFFNLIAMFLYYSLGTTLERTWGTFRFNLYFVMGILCHILAAFAVYFITGKAILLTTYYLNNSLFLAFAVTFPQLQFYLFALLPIKAYWLGLFIGAEFVYEFIMGNLASRLGIGLAMLNFLVFFFMTRDYKRVSPREIRRKQQFRSDTKKAEIQKIRLTHHKCAVCGRTEKDAPDLEFRYCSKCEGNLEYCMDHLYTHRHVTKEDTERED